MDGKLKTTEEDLLEAKLKAFDVEKSVTAEKQAQVNALKDIYDLEVNLKKTIGERFHKEIELSKEVKSLESQLRKQQEKTRTIVGDQLKIESKLAEMAFEQQISFLKKEQEMLALMNSASVAPFLFILTKAWELFKSFDKSAYQFRMEMGMTRDAAGDIRDMVQKISVEFMDVGVSIDGVYKAVSVLGNVMGSVYNVSKDLVKTTSLLKSQLGVSEEITADFLRNMASISGTTMEAQQNTAYMAANLANAAGVPLSAVMKDVATHSDTTLTMISRIPLQVVKTAVELRRMGSDLDKAAKSSREILNFTESVNAEMEASVLIGQSINLQKARELAYRKDLVGSTKEILRLTKQVNFEQLDVFQQEAFAKATGKSVDELLGMVQAEKQLNAARNSQDPKMRARVADYEKMKSLNEATMKDSAKQLEMQIIQKSNQERIVAIQNKWNAIVAKVTENLLPTIDILLSIVPTLMDIGIEVIKVFSWFKAIEGIFGKINTIALAAEMSFVRGGQALSIMEKTSVSIYNRFSGFKNVLSNIVNIFKSFLGISSKIGTASTKLGVFSSIGKTIANIFKPLTTLFSDIIHLVPAFGKFAALFSTFGKAIPVIGQVITAIQFLVGAFRGFSEARAQGHGWAASIGIGILKGLQAVVQPIWDLLTWPFKKAWSWFSSSPLAGHSPSEMGLSIVKGIASVGAMIYDAITYPFRKAFSWILKHIPGMGKFASVIDGGATGIVNKISGDEKSTIKTNPINTQNNQQAQSPQPTQPTNTQASNSKYSMDDVYDMLKTLNDNLTNGKVKSGDIYLDSSLVSTALARGIAFKGSFGTNR